MPAPVFLVRRNCPRSRLSRNDDLGRRRERESEREREREGGRERGRERERERGCGYDRKHLHTNYTRSLIESAAIRDNVSYKFSLLRPLLYCEVHVAELRGGRGGGHLRADAEEEGGDVCRRCRLPSQTIAANANRGKLAAIYLTI